MIIVGVSRHGRFRRLFTGTTGRPDRAPRRQRSTSTSSPTTRWTGPIRVRARPVDAVAARQVTGWLMAVLLPRSSGVGAAPVRGHRPAAAGDAHPARVHGARRTRRWAAVRRLLAAVAGFLVLNWFFTPPSARSPSPSRERPGADGVRGRRRGRGDRGGPGLAPGRGAPRARTEAATFGALPRSVLTGQDTAEAIVERIHEDFGQDSVSLLEKDDVGLARARLDRQPRPPPHRTRATAGSPSTTTT